MAIINNPLIPNLPPHRMVVTKDGQLHDDYFNFFANLTQSLKQALSNEGLKIPAQTAANISALNTTQSIGKILYDADHNLFVANINGIFKTITTS